MLYISTFCHQLKSFELMVGGISHLLNIEESVLCVQQIGNK